MRRHLRVKIDLPPIDFKTAIHKYGSCFSRSVLTIPASQIARTMSAFGSMDADGFAAGLADDVLGFEIDAAGKPARLGSRAEAAAFARDMSEAELRLAAEEVRLSCTEGMLMSLDRDDRIAYTLAEVCEFDGVQAAEVLQIEPAAYRKRLSRARDRLATWMTGKCGIVNPLNACRCARLPKLEKGQTTLL